MLEGLADEKVDSYLEENPRIVPLFEINVTEVVGPYIKSNQAEEELQELDLDAVVELRWAHKTFEHEMEIPRCVKA